MFYIVNNGGDIRYPPNGLAQPEPDAYSENIRGLLDDGFHFHYDGKRNHVISFFMGRVNIDTNSDQLISNQFYGIYYGDGTEPDLLQVFKQKVESAFDSQGWRTSESDQSIDAIYTNLTSADPVEPDVDKNELDAALRGSEDVPQPIELGAPDYTSALQICKQFIEDYEDIRVTICSSGSAEGHPETDVVVIPHETDEPGAPANETKEYFDEQSYDDQISTARKSVEEFIETEDDEDNSSERALVAALDRGFNTASLSPISEFGVHIDTPEQRERLHSGIGDITTFFGAVFGILLAVGVARFFGYLESVLNLFTSTVYLKPNLIPGANIPADPIPIQSYTIIGVSLGILLLSMGIKIVRVLSVGATTVQWVLPMGSKRQTDALSSETATADAKDILERLNDLENHPSLGAAQETGQAIKSVFNPFESIEVIDQQTHRLAELKTALQSFTKGIIVAAFFVVTFTLLGIIAGEFWLWFLQGLYGFSVAIFVWKGWPIALSGANTIARGIRSSDSSEKTLPGAAVGKQLGIMLFAAWSTSHLAGSLVWDQANGLVYNVTNGIIGKTVGQIGNPRIGIEIGFFAAVSFVVGVLVVDILERSDRSDNSVILLAFSSVGLLTLWIGSSNVLATQFLWVLGIAIGGIAGFAFASDRSPIGSNRSTEYLSYPIGILVIGAFVEGLITYQSPIRYDISSGQFVMGSFEFTGLAYAVNVGGIALSLGHLVATMGALYVLVGIVRSKRDLEVMVIGPPGSSPAYHVSLLFHALHTERGVMTDPNKNVQTLQQNGDKIQDGVEPEELLEFTGLESARFTAKPSEKTELTVWAPVPGSAFFEPDVFNHLDHSEELVRPGNLPEDGYPTMDDQAFHDLATSFVSADIVILLFPAESPYMETNPLEQSEMEATGGASQAPAYIQIYQNLLNQQRKEHQEVLGVITNAGNILQEETPIDMNNLEEVNKNATDIVFDNCEIETKYAVLSPLANEKDNSLPVVAKLSNQDTIGVSEEIDDLSTIIDTEL